MKVALQNDMGCFFAHALGFTASSELSTRPRKRKRIADENDNECAPNIIVLDCPRFRTMSWGFTHQCHENDLRSHLSELHNSALRDSLRPLGRFTYMEPPAHPRGSKGGVLKV